MIRFKTFMSESVRQGLPHLHSTETSKGNQTPSLSIDQFAKTTHGGKIHIHGVTEKTDGQTFRMGHDHHGFYTQHSGSADEKARTGQDHIDRSKRRAKERGIEYDHNAPSAMAKFHDALHSNKALTDHLAHHFKKTGQEVIVKGEAFNKHMAKPSEHKGEVKFVHTSYHEPKAKHGTFVIHSKLPGNEHHDTEHFKKHLSNHDIHFDDDKVHHTGGHVNVKDEVHDFHKLDHELINTRTKPTNKAAKLAEIEKFNNVKKRVTHKVEAHVAKLGIKNKWGSGSEGLVVHPSEHNPHATRFKVINPAFKKAKETGGRFGDKK